IQSRRGLLPVAAYGPRCMRLLLPGAQNRIFIPNLAESKGRAVIGRGLDGLTLKSAVSGPKRWTTQVLTSILARAEPAPSSRSRGAVTAGGVPDPHRAANAVCGRGIFLPIETFSGAVSRTIPAQRGLAPRPSTTGWRMTEPSPHRGGWPRPRATRSAATLTARLISSQIIPSVYTERLAALMERSGSRTCGGWTGRSVLTDVSQRS